MSDGENLLLCYNRGCAVKFDPENNSAGSCLFHPGEPFFHDAFKGWSCCNKKCTDFTEFLNMKGCTNSFHNGKKPNKSEKYVSDKNDNKKVINCQVPKKSLPTRRTRPPAHLPLEIITPTLSPALLQQITATTISSTHKNDLSGSTDIPVGTMCTNSGCKQAYEGAGFNYVVCQYHPGGPVFHEGMKYWSCCKKKTSEFTVFLEQVGCTEGEHCWIKDTRTTGQENCRLDWHQTGPWVVVSIFAKKYDPYNSLVKLSAVKLSIELRFPTQNSVFSKNMELCGIIDVCSSSVSMFPTKVEIKMKKAESVYWGTLDYPKSTFSDNTDQSKNSGKNGKEQSEKTNNIVESVDLGDL